MSLFSAIFSHFYAGNVKPLTYDGWPDDGGDPLEEEQQPEGVGEPLQTEEVDQDDGGEAHVGARGHAEHGAVGDLVEGGDSNFNAFRTRHFLKFIFGKCEIRRNTSNTEQ